MYGERKDYCFECGLKMIVSKRNSGIREFECPKCSQRFGTRTDRGKKCMSCGAFLTDVGGGILRCTMCDEEYDLSDFSKK